MQKSLYEVLQIPPKATQKQLKSQFYELSKQYHPDKNGSSERFIEISNAYAILSDPVKRKEYDYSIQETYTVRQPRQSWARQKINPDDWILYKRKTTMNPGFNHKVHQEQHYGTTNNNYSDAKRQAIRDYYQELYEQDHWHYSAFRYFVFFGCCGMLFYSDLFQLLFT